MNRLLTQLQRIDELAVGGDVGALQVVEKLTTTAHHLQKTTAGVVILLVNLDVFGELVDSLSENSDLTLRRTCVVLVKAVSLDYGCLFFLS